MCDTHTGFTRSNRVCGSIRSRQRSHLVVIQQSYMDHPSLVGIDQPKDTRAISHSTHDYSLAFIIHFTTSDLTTLGMETIFIYSHAMHHSSSLFNHIFICITHPSEGTHTFGEHNSILFTTIRAEQICNRGRIATRHLLTVCVYLYRFVFDQYWYMFIER